MDIKKHLCHLIKGKGEKGKAKQDLPKITDGTTHMS